MHFRNSLPQDWPHLVISISPSLETTYFSKEVIILMLALTLNFTSFQYLYKRIIIMHLFIWLHFTSILFYIHVALIISVAFVLTIQILGSL